LTTAERKPKLIVLLGPTASGKTNLSIEISKRFGCEIISGDSMQVYRGMDIGTAKITEQEREGVVHHMIDICEPDYPFSAAEFQATARRLIAEINDRGRIPFIVGGTGLYIESVCYDYQFSEVGSDEAFREEQRLFAEKHGAEALHDKLRQIDPEAAERLHPNDQRRVIRALEVHHLTGSTSTGQRRGQEKQSPYDLVLIGLTMDRDLLYKRIEERIDLMIRQGLVDEVRDLLDRGMRTEYISMQGLGYKEIAAYLRGEYNLDRAIELLKRDTRHFAKRQLSWFRHMQGIHWVDVTDSTNFSGHLNKINAILAGKFRMNLEYISEQS